MVDYRRNFLPGGTYFFTVTLNDRRSAFLIDHIELLRTAFQQTHKKFPFGIDAICVLPDHLHTVWTLPPDDADYPGRWRAVKSTFSRLCVRNGVLLKKNKKGEYDLWQRRYWEHTIKNEQDLQRHIDYLHYNPVKHGYVKRVVDWPCSSFHRYVERGLLPSDWAGTKDIFDGDEKYGE